MAQFKKPSQYSELTNRISLLHLIAKIYWPQAFFIVSAGFFVLTVYC